jgi:hypothetical protein
MRYHPAHRVVLQHISTRMLECKQQFTSLLGIRGFIETLVKVTPFTRFLHNARAIGFGRPVQFLGIFVRINLRAMARRVKMRHPSYIGRDLDGIKRAANVASYTDFQRYRRDAK